MDLSQIGMLGKGDLAQSIPTQGLAMTAMRDSRSAAGAAWRKVAALMLGVAAVGLPINDIAGYALLVALAVAIFVGEVSARAKAWIAAVALVVRRHRRAIPAGAAAHRGRSQCVSARRRQALQRGLPAEVYRAPGGRIRRGYIRRRMRCDQAVRLLAGRRLSGSDLCLFRRRRLAQAGLSRSVTDFDFPIRCGCASASSTRSL